MFKYQAFTENSPELLKFLIDIGYQIYICDEYHDTSLISTFNIEHSDIITCSVHGIDFSSEEMSSKQHLAMYLRDTKNIDCRGNAELFKAIVAIRDDSDYMQYFVTEADQSWVNQEIHIPKGSLELCLIKDRYMGENKKFCNSIVPAHKASVDELINYFKHK